MRKSSSDCTGSTLERITIVMLGVYLAALGVHAIAAGHLLYKNSLRMPVFAPLAVIIGAVLISAAIAMRN